jgi:hypothetical protein
VGVSTILIATIMWVIAMLVTNTFVDTFSLQASSAYALEYGEVVRTQGAAVVVIVDVGMIIWMMISAFRRETQEDMLR